MLARHSFNPIETPSLISLLSEEWVPVLIQKILKRLSRINTVRGALDAIRVLFDRENILYVPFGNGNSKTNLPGFYCKVGDSCPECPYEKGFCYGKQGNVNMHQQRASMLTEAIVNSFVAVTVVSLLYTGHASRSVVSGDFYKDRVVNEELVTALCSAAEHLKVAFGTDIVSYGYTHGHDKNLMATLEKSGIVVLESDYLGAGGAIVYPHSQVPELKERAKEEGFKLVKCPAQLSEHISCANCNVCVEARDKDYCVVFDPHGTKKSSFAPVVFNRNGYPVPAKNPHKPICHRDKTISYFSLYEGEWQHRVNHVPNFELEAMPPKQGAKVFFHLARK